MEGVLLKCVDKDHLVKILDEIHIEVWSNYIAKIKSLKIIKVGFW